MPAKDGIPRPDLFDRSLRHTAFMQAARADRRSRATRAAQLVGVVVLAMLASSSRPRGAASMPRPPHRRRPRPGGHMLPQPVTPHRPNTLTGGAAAELTFDD